MKRVLITGANGQLGKAILRKLILKKEYRVYSCDICDDLEIDNYFKLDITDYLNCKYFINSVNPDIIINCAGFTKVDMRTDEYENAYDVNINAVSNMLNICKNSDCRFIQISTDYVFDGEKTNPYLERDKTGPLNYYGKTKLDSEHIVLNSSDNNIVIRTAWMYGDGNNFINSMFRLYQNNSVIRVVDDQIGSPTSADSVSDLILFMLADMDSFSGIYHATCEGQVSWYEYAKKIFEIKNIDVDVEPISSEIYNSIAVRPKYSVLENERLKRIGYFFPKWDDELYRYLVNLKM